MKNSKDKYNVGTLSLSTFDNKKRGYVEDVR